MEGKRRIDANTAKDGLVIAADAQTFGRGRWNRSWYSPRGKGLYVSILLQKKKAKTSLFHLLPLAVANALSSVLENQTGLSFELRWPNDIYVSNRKIAGILTEAYRGYWIIGLGVNILGSPKTMPKDIAEHATTLRHASGQELAPDAILHPFLDMLGSHTLEKLRKDPAQIITEWQLGSKMLGKPVLVRVNHPKGNEMVRGIAERISPTGQLIVRSFDGKLRKFISGEVIHVS